MNEPPCLSMRTPGRRSACIYLWSPHGNTWYDSPQTKVAQRFSHGLIGKPLAYATEAP